MKNNKIYMLKVSQLCKTKHDDDDEDGALHVAFVSAVLSHCLHVDATQKVSTRKTGETSARHSLSCQSSHVRVNSPLICDLFRRVIR